MTRGVAARVVDALVLLLFLYNKDISDFHWLAGDGHTPRIVIAELVDVVDSVGVESGEVDKVLKHIQTQWNAFLNAEMLHQLSV